VAYSPIAVDEARLEIMGVRFDDVESLRRAANALGSNMFEGLVPTPQMVELFREFAGGRIALANLSALVAEEL
jgi:hypothetical protein